MASYTAPRFEKGQQSQNPTEGVETGVAHVGMQEAIETPPLKYQYRPLPSPNSVRLIDLLPGRGLDPIFFSLRTVNLEDAEPFEALSYVWGTGNRRAILCFDHGTVPQSKNSTLEVTLNCWHALHRLRFEDKSRDLWIDAICINQEDRKERSQQVSLMGNLYRMASCVLVYLNSYDLSVQFSDVFKLLRELAEQASRFPEGMGNCRSAFGEVDHSIVTSFRKFFENAWFKRCWTLQEVGLARRALLVCDGDELEWDVLFSVVRWFNRHQTLDRINLDLPTQELENSISLYDAFEKGKSFSFEHQSDILDVLSATRSRQCTDPKDRLFAFMGHPTAINEDGPLIRPSYIVVTWMVFYEFAISYLKRTESLRILSAVDHGRKPPPPNFPLSWVPWWDTSECSFNLGLSSLYRASAGSEEFQNIRLGGITLDDLDLDEVLEDSPLFEWQELMMPSSYTDESLEYILERSLRDIDTYQMMKRMSSLEGLRKPSLTVDELQGWYQPGEAKLSVKDLILDEATLTYPILDKEYLGMHSFSAEKDPDGHAVEQLCRDILEKMIHSRYEDSLLALSLTLVAGLHNSKLLADLNEHKASFTAYRHAIQTFRLRMLTREASRELISGTANGASIGTESLGSLPPDSLWQKYMVDAVQACYGRRFFATAAGYFGLGPAAITGENIFCCILFGATVPFLLQKHGDVYRLVGEAYVHGVMDGEAIEMWKRGELEEVDIQLF
jgi:hypothetical protein